MRCRSIAIPRMLECFGDWPEVAPAPSGKLAAHSERAKTSKLSANNNGMRVLNGADLVQI